LRDPDPGLSLLIYDVIQDRVDELTVQDCVSSAASLDDLARQADVILLVVKPKEIGKVLERLHSHLGGDKIVISSAAGVTVDSVRAAAGPAAAVFRIMPNLGVELGEGVVAVATEPETAPETTDFVLRLLAPLGLVELVGEDLSAETNFQHRTIRTLDEALKFAQTVGFPDHGLIVMSSANPPQSEEIAKGIVTPAHLESAVEEALRRSPTGTIHLETDMRALYNPTRMKAIARATLNLVQAAQRTCPQCDRPGFAPVEYRKGLPCEWCGLPTRLTRSVLYQCSACQFQQESLFPDGARFADPGQCQYCNA
jgi:hypothetical protein